ncbi:tryptophan synthase subunit beta [bacterium]|nr:tryptophan synthase subunit beta [bacterium]
MPALAELARAHTEALADPGFAADLDVLLRDFAGRPTPLDRARRLEAALDSPAPIYLKREDLLHTGAHKLNNTIGQVLLARRMGKRRIIAETGAGQHGVATAAVCARFGLECIVYMGETDMQRQRPNVQRMHLFGAEVRPARTGRRTLQDATSEAIRDWVANVETTYYVIGSAVGPHPYPELVAGFQTVIGGEARAQILDAEGRLPSHAVACVGGGSNALGLFRGFLDDPEVALVGVEAGGSADGHARTLGLGDPGVLHGAMSLLLQDEDGQVAPVHSVSAGLDYPGVGPQLAHLVDTFRLVAAAATDAEALAAFADLCRLEGILPALETAHAIAHLRALVREPDVRLVVVNCSGRGDKDLDHLPEEVTP